MRKFRNPTAIVFIIIFVILSSFTALLFSQAINKSTDIPYSIESDYFDIYSFNPVKDSPSKIIDQPSYEAFPQRRYEYNHHEIDFIGGVPSTDGISPSSVEDFEEKISNSDDIYGYVIPTDPTQNELLKNYYVFIDKENNIFQLPLSPDLDKYLSFDTIDGTSGTLVDDSDLEEISSRINVANNPYALPDNETFIEIESDTQSESVSIDLSTGGISIYNNSLYDFYQLLDDNRDIIIEGKFEPSNLLSFFYGSTQEQYYEYTIISNIIQSRNRNFFIWFAEKCFTYESFLDGMGIDLNLGYKIFATFNPYSITEINGKIALYIDAPLSDPDYAEIKNYSIQCYNYIVEDWVTILTRPAHPLLTLTNTWLFDEFLISSNPWQYIYNFQGNSDEAQSFLKWRVVVEGDRDVDDDQPIKVRLGGLWTSITQDFIEFNFQMSFKVTEEGITKQDIESCRLVVEYHSENWDSLYDVFYISREVGTYTYSEKYYDLDTGVWEVDTHTITYESALDNGEFYAYPTRDNRVAVSVPDEMINDLTWVTVNIHGIFSKYNRQGAAKDVEICFDKISMQYEYEGSVEIERKTWINYNSIDLFYWSYDIDISSSIVNLEFDYPSDWIFIDRYFGLVEKLETGRNITDIWIQANSDENYENLYDGDTVRIDERTIFYIGPGTYRFWFRSFNYIKDISVFNSTLDPYELGDAIEVDDLTYYNVTLSDLWRNPLYKSDYEGSMSVKFSGYSSNGKQESEVGPFQGVQFNYTEGGDVKWNKWFVNYTHTYADDMYGYIQVEFFWQSEDTEAMGYQVFWLYIAYISDEKPIISLIDPIEDGRWGINDTNYVALASWHLNTESAWMEIEGETTQLTQLSSLSDQEGAVIPESLTTIPSYLEQFYWFAEVDTERLGEIYDVESTGSASVDIKVGSTASYGMTTIESDNTTVSVNLIAHPNFILDPVQNVYIGNKPRITYNCPDGIIGMDVYIEGGVEPFLIAEIGGNENTESSYLYKGYHTFTIPFRFTTPGNFQISLSVEDDVGNVFSVYSNEFSVIDTDDRLWITRVLDEAIEVSILWFAYLSMGIIYMRRKRNKPKVRL